MAPEEASVNVLIVGAGAVGQVYARHLQLAGHHVSFLVKEKYRVQCQAGLPLYPLNGFQKGEQVTLRPDEVLTGPAQVAERHFDQVWLCISSPALKGQWLDSLVEAMGEAVLVFMTPGLRDGERLADQVPPDRRVQGLIGFISWQSPLSTETRENPGIAEFLPPGSPSQFGGAEEPARAIVQALKQGHCPARYNPRVDRAAAQGSAVLLAAIAGLEIENWSLSRLRNSSTLAAIATCARQSMGVAANWQGHSPPWLRILIRPILLRAAIGLAPRLVPFDLETYLAYHFTKVGEQTRHHLDTLLALGQERSLPVDGIEALRNACLDQPIGERRLLEPGPHRLFHLSGDGRSQALVKAGGMGGENRAGRDCKGGEFRAGLLGKDVQPNPSQVLRLLQRRQVHTGPPSGVDHQGPRSHLLECRGVQDAHTGRGQGTVQGHHPGQRQEIRHGKGPVHCWIVPPNPGPQVPPGLRRPAANEAIADHPHVQTPHQPHRAAGQLSPGPDTRPCPIVQSRQIPQERQAHRQGGVHHRIPAGQRASHDSDPPFLGSPEVHVVVARGCGHDQLQGSGLSQESLRHLLATGHDQHLDAVQIGLRRPGVRDLATQGRECLGLSDQVQVGLVGGLPPAQQAAHRVRSR